MLLMKCLISFILSTVISSTALLAEDMRRPHDDRSQFEHRLYFSMPFSINNKVKSTNVIKYGYSFNMLHNYMTSSRQRIQRRDFKAALFNIQFSPSQENTIKLAGMPLFQFNWAGIYLDEKIEEAGDSSKLLLIGAGTLGVLALAVATSGEEEEPLCDPATINGVPIIFLGSVVCKSSDL